MLSSLVPSSFTCSAARVAIRRPFVAAAPAQRPIRRAIRCAAAADEYQTLSTSPIQPIMDKGELQLHKLANMAGVYAVYDKEGSLQYIGLSRKIDASISNHMTEIPELTHSVKYWSVENTSRESLVAAWKLWIEEAAEQMGNIPPGNAPGETRWQSRKAAPMKKEIKLTAGKPISGITIEQLVDQVVKTNKIVAFVKGTRGQPQCGFSNKMMQILNESKADYEVVNVLDDVHNPGLRDAIKTYSQWPTIPQLYVKGEFVGGADICEQMHTSGELQKLLQEQ